MGGNAVEVCQQEIRRQVDANNAGRTTVNFGPTNVTGGGPQQYVQGTATIYGDFGSRPIRYNCTFQQGRLISATYTPTGGGVVPPPVMGGNAVEVCQQEIRRQVAANNAGPVSVNFGPTNVTGGGPQQYVQGTATVHGNFGTRGIRYNCTVQQGRLISATYGPY
jgi:hypothetical protein